MLGQVISEGVARFCASDIVYRGIDDKLLRATSFRLQLPWRVPDGSMRVTATTVKRRTLILDRPNPAN
jgi:hypothetical protein